MAKIFSRKAKRAGFTLITALAFTIVVGTVLAGVGTVALSHLGRSKTEGSYANAIALADAGVNYEMNWISQDPTNITSAHTPSSPGTGSISGKLGSFEVYTRTWDSNNNTCGTGAWTNPLQDFCIVSKGTFDGVERTIQIRGIHKSVFDEYAIYAISDGKLGGGGSGAGTTTIVGDMGTNGELTFNGTKGSGIDTGTVYMNGPDAGLANQNMDNGNTASNDDPVIFPSVKQWADKTFTGGLTWLAANNNNANIKMLNSADTALAGEPTVAGFTLSDVNSKLVSAGFTASSRTFGDPNGPSASATIDKASSTPSSAWRFVQPDTIYIDGAYGIADKSGYKVYFVPPGDYYFTRLDIKQGTSVVVFLTHLGPIHLWVDQGNNQADSLNGVFLFTDPSPAKFRVFYNKCNTLTITGSSLFPGGFYAVNPTCDDTKSTQGTPEVKFTGSSEVLGSVIANYMTIGGGTSIIFPNNAGGDPTDFALWFGFKDRWKEIPHNNSSTVFADGTGN